MSCPLHHRRIPAMKDKQEADVLLSVLLNECPTFWSVDSLPGAADNVSCVAQILSG